MIMRAQAPVTSQKSPRGAQQKGFGPRLAGDERAPRPRIALLLCCAEQVSCSQGGICVVDILAGKAPLASAAPQPAINLTLITTPALPAAVSVKQVGGAITALLRAAEHAAHEAG